MSEQPNQPESLQAIIGRMGTRFEKPDDASALLPDAVADSALPVLPVFIQAETFLENSGYFTPSSKRIKRIYIKEKRVKEITNQDGTRKILTTKISANHELGLPITSDLDYYRAFLKILDETIDRDGRIRQPIAVPTRKLVKYAGKRESAPVWREAKEWFRRMTLTGLEGAVYRAKMKDFDQSLVSTVFSQVVLYGERMKSGKAAETNYVWLAPWFLSNYYYRYTRPIDYTFYKRLRKPIAKSLYTILSSGWYASNGSPYSKSYGALCDEFLLTKHHHFSYIKQQLDPSHQELQRLGLLEQWEYRQSSKKQEYVIVYHAGKKFFEDRREQRRRTELAEKGFVRDTCNFVSQRDSSRKVSLLGQHIGTMFSL